MVLGAGCGLVAPAVGQISGGTNGLPTGSYCRSPPAGAPLKPMPPDTSPRPLGAWRPWLLALALWLLIAAVASLALWQLRRTALDAQERQMALLSLALADELDRGLNGAEEGLQALAQELGRRSGWPGAGGDTVQALQTRAALMPLVTVLWLLNEQRAVMAASDTTPRPTTPPFCRRWPNSPRVRWP